MKSLSLRARERQKTAGSKKNVPVKDWVRRCLTYVIIAAVTFCAGIYVGRKSIDPPAEIPPTEKLEPAGTEDQKKTVTKDIESLEFYEKLKKKEPAAPAIKSKKAPVAPTKQVEKKAPEKPTDKKPGKKTALKKTKPVKPSAPSYIIQVASFTEPENADNLSKKLNQAGFKTRIRKTMKANKNWYTVYLGPYKSKAEAQTILPKIRKHQKSAFVMKKARPK
jgi:cell division protein FtsN